jgi:D-3-phosphoglycerate dehydrogenase / 2-oxoglutarate reductase
VKTVFLTHSPAALAHYVGPKALAALDALAHVRRNPHESGDLPQLLAAAGPCDVIVADRLTPGTAELFAALPQLMAFCRCAVDIRNIDVDAASRHGVLVTQASAGFMASVSEWVIGAMIELSRGLGAASHAYRRGETPAITMGRELRGSTLGVIGYGHIGRYLGDLGLAFGMQVCVSDPHAAPTRCDVQRVGLPELLARSDYVVCLAVANAQTENLMDARAFAAMKPDAFFINASRGNLVDEDALLKALDAGALAGCALDVGRAADQMPSPALARHPKVLATPHIGGLTPPAIEHQALEVVEQVRQILQGRVPAKGAVNPVHARRLARPAESAA